MSLYHTHGSSYWILWPNPFSPGCVPSQLSSLISHYMWRFLVSLYVIHMDHPTGFCGLILADHSLFSPRCVPSQLSSLISVEID